MRTSLHYKEERKYREKIIKKIGLGKIVYSIIVYDEKRKRNYKYEITENAVLRVLSEDGRFLVTQYPARPSRITKYWENVPQEILEKSIAYSREGLTF